MFASGVLIVGGVNSGGNTIKSAEEFNPETRHSCSVGDIPQASRRGSLCNNMYCVGSSCLRFHVNNASFTPLPVKLVSSRSQGLCWGLPSGEVLLMGGKTTERVSANGSSSSPDFNMPYETR